MKYVDSAGVVREKDLTLEVVDADGTLALSTWYEYDDPMKIRSYSWLRNGYDNSGDYDADGLI